MGGTLAAKPLPGSLCGENRLTFSVVIAGLSFPGVGGSRFSRACTEVPSIELERLKVLPFQFEELLELLLLDLPRSKPGVQTVQKFITGVT